VSPARPRAIQNSANGDGKWDLEAAAAASNGAAGEAGNAPFEFTYKGTDYTIPPMTRWPVAALRAVAQGDFDNALVDLLGLETYEALAAAGLNVGELTALFDKVSEESGMGGAGNSPPPRRPSSIRR
jgi:hypothetical protein